jgi:hypothetical protein
LFDESAEAIELRIPEHFVMPQPGKRAGGRALPQRATHHPPRLASRDEPGLLEDAEMLDEPGQRHPVRRRQLAHRAFAVAQVRKDGTARGIGERAEHGIERR